MTTTELKTFKIPTENLHNFDVKFGRLVRKAVKLHLDAPSYRITKTWIRPATIEDNGKVTRPSIELNTVIVSGAAPTLPGYRFLAVLEHAEEGIFIHRVPGTDDVLIRADLRSSKPVCEHCKTARTRTETFVVEHIDTHQQLSVGRQCIADFLGGESPERIAAWAECIAAFCSGHDDEERDIGGRGTTSWSLGAYLGYVVKVANKDGWLSRTKAKEQGFWAGSTADLAFSGMSPTNEEAKVEFLKDYGPMTVEDNEKGLALLRWVEEYLDTLPETEFEASEYLYNVRLIVNAGDVRIRTSGIAASIFRIRQRALETEVAERSRTRRCATSNYVGEPKQRLTFSNLLLEKVIDIQGDYGCTHLHIFIDSAGNELKWFATRECLDTGKAYNVKGTIKKHEEYKGVKATLLNRCVCTEA
jgi:hypothetical protein